MSRTNMALAAAAAALALSAAAAASASAVNWYVAGTKLATTAALNSTAKVSTAAVIAIPAASTEVSCSGAEPKKSELIAPGKGKASGLTLSGCSVLKPSNCKLSTSSIATEAVDLEATTDSSAEDHVTFSPQSGKQLGTLEFSGSGCVLTGEQALRGDLTMKAPEGDEEETEQPIEGLGTVENNSLELGGDKAYVTAGNIKLKLASGKAFSGAFPQWFVNRLPLGNVTRTVQTERLEEGFVLQWTGTGGVAKEIKCTTLLGIGNTVGSLEALIQAKFTSWELGGCSMMPTSCEVEVGAMLGVFTMSNFLAILTANLGEFRLASPPSTSLASFTLVNKGGGTCTEAGALTMKVKNTESHGEVFEPTNEVRLKTFKLTGTNVEVARGSENFAAKLTVAIAFERGGEIWSVNFP